MNIAVIPARGGSKRIPGKNIRSFAGKPLIAYSLSAATASAVFDEIIISTDDDAIAELALSLGATYVVKRPESLANDIVGTTPVVKHALETYQREQQVSVDFVCCIYATAPFLQAEFLRNGLMQLKQNTYKSFAFSVTSFGFPIQRAIRVTDGGVEPISKELMGKRSQDLETCYHDAGQFYWGRSKAYQHSERMFAAHSIPIILPRHLVQDIDTEEDWQRAELMYNAYVKE